MEIYIAFGIGFGIVATLLIIGVSYLALSREDDLEEMTYLPLDIDI